MDDGTPGTGGGTEHPGPGTIPLRPGTSAEDLLAALHRQGISDLETLVARMLEQVREATAEDDANPTTDYFVSEHYVLIRETEIVQ